MDAKSGSAWDCAIADVIFVVNSTWYVNEKKYYITVIDLLYKLGYYDSGTHKSLFKEIK